MPNRYKIEYHWNTPRDTKRTKQDHGSATRHHQMPTMDRTKRKGPPPTGSDLRQGKTTRPRLKELGIVDPVCSGHSEVEKEYVIIRQRVEVYVESQVRGENEENRCRVGGQLEEQQRLLERLAQRFSCSRDTQDETEPDREPERSAEPSVKTDPSVIITPSSSSPLDKNTQHSFLPEVQNRLTSRTVPPPFADDNIADSRRGMAVANLPHYQNPPHHQNPHYYTADVSKNRPRNGPLMVVKKPLSSRMEKETKEEELVRGFDVIRRVNQHYPDTNAQDNRGRTADHCLVPQHAQPSDVMSARSSRETYSRIRSIRNAGMTPKNTNRADDEVPWNGKPPSPTFHFKRVGEMEDGRPLFWKPVVSRRGYDPFVEPLKKEEEMDEDQTAMSRVPSRIIVNIVVPRTGRCGKERLCDRQWTTLGQQPFRAWLSSAPSPPPPPPPTAPTVNDYNGCDDDDEQFDGDENAADDNTTDQQNLNLQSDGISPTPAPNPSQEVNCIDKPSSASGDSTDKPKHEKHPFASKSISNERTKTKKATCADSSNEPEAKNSQTGGRKELSAVGEGRQVDVTPDPTTRPTAVPPLNLGPRMQTAESTFSSIHQPRDPDPDFFSPCRRATHCEFFGPHLCVDCETARHRRQFLARQNLLYPEINVFPRHMVASQKFKASKGGHTRLPKLTNSASSRWPYASDSQLNSIVTDFDLCKRVAEKGRKA